jgi:FMN reductase
MTNHRERLRIAGICGSIRKASYTRLALALALRGAEEAGAQAELIDLRDYRVIFCDGKEDESHYPEDVFKLREAVRRAQGIILATPEYQGGYSGVLKNALDLMGFEEFEGKMLGLIGVSDGRLGAFGAMHSLRDVVRALHAWVVPEQASVPQAWEVFDETGALQRRRDRETAKGSRLTGGAIRQPAHGGESRRVPAPIREHRRESGRREPMKSM